MNLPGFKGLRDPPWTPVTQPRLQGDDGRADVFAAMRAGDLLVHHPYDSFATSVERFVAQAVADPDVLAIKQTVYRTSDDSPLVPALIRASERGKQAVCLVELKARFDERANIQWAKSLEEAGVHVTYGIPSLKTHAKAILVVRREGDGVRHYVHIGTGNYHPKTARLYTDFGLFTTDEEIGADVADLFNFLTGYARPRGYRKVLVAPAHLRDGILEQIESTIERHREHGDGRVTTVIVLDACGAGDLPDADAYGDAGANTLEHIAERPAASTSRRSAPRARHDHAVAGVPPAGRPWCTAASTRSARGRTPSPATGR